MRLQFVERLAALTMKSFGIDRRAALMRLTLFWAGLGALCLAGYAWAPIEKMTITRRGTEVPLDVLLAGCGGLFLLFALVCFLSRLSR